ncbi:TetR/AcrR family transcriptional regulator [Mycolicibacterium lutetiense]
MTTATVDDPGRPATTRRRMLDTAMELFGRYGFAGTSLQMIADELDLTKAAIYYHFRTREQLLIALMEPILTEIGAVVEIAEGRRGKRARAESMLTGYADIVTRNRALAAVTTFDPNARAVLRNQPEWSAVIDRQLSLLAAATGGVGGSISAAVMMTGLAGGASTAAPDIDDDTLRTHLIAVGRRALGLPEPNSAR